jgi:hypothetical protein
LPNQKLNVWINIGKIEIIIICINIYLHINSYKYIHTNTMDQDARREFIKKIKADTNLTEKEKSIKIQQIFSSNYTNQIQSESNVSHTCSHYTKCCSKFKFTCCEITDPCKRCHLERVNCEPKDIRITSITCNLCGLEQEPSPQCFNRECGVEFSNSYCVICQIWMHKEIYHCVDCGICRIGTQQTLVHCMDCGKNSQTPFHFYGLECVECGSFNTQE